MLVNYAGFAEICLGPPVASQTVIVELAYALLAFVDGAAPRRDCRRGNTSGQGRSSSLWGWERRLMAREAVMR